MAKAKTTKEAQAVTGMVKVKALRKFRDKYTGEEYSCDEEFDVSADRAREMNNGRYGKLVEVLTPISSPDGTGDQNSGSGSPAPVVNEGAQGAGEGAPAPATTGDAS